MEGSRWCGLVTALMQECFGDKDITGNGGWRDPAIWNNPDKNAIFSQNKKMKQQAEEYCKIIVYLQCQPKKPTPNVACKAYLNAASSAGYHLLFSGKIISTEESSMDVMTIEKAIEHFKDKKSADDFINKEGDDWYFCKFFSGFSNQK